MGMKQFLIVASGGAGGDLQPLVASALAIRDRRYQIAFIGDRSVERALSALGVAVQVLPPELDIGPRLAGAVRGAMAATAGDIVAAGPIVEERMAEWAGEVSQTTRVDRKILRGRRRRTPMEASERENVWSADQDTTMASRGTHGTDAITEICSRLSERTESLPFGSCQGPRAWR